MSWTLREYFVFTEYMIKKNVLPLFKGLTMANDQAWRKRKEKEGKGETQY